MKQKAMIAVLAVILAILLALGFYLSLTRGKDDKMPAPTTTAQATPGDSTPGITTPGVTTSAATTPGATTPGATTPGATTPGATTPAATTPVPTTPAPTTPAPTTPAPTTPAPTTPAPTTPAPTTPAPTTPAPTTPAPTTPAPTTPAPTSPPHVHAYVGTVTEPTLTTEGYTTYKCACGDSYVGDKTPVLTLQQHVDRLPLHPNITGVSTLDGKVQGVLAGGNTTYNKLLAVHNFLRASSHGNADSTLSQMAAFAGNKVFKSVSELKFAYDANQVFTNRVGKAEHFAAAYAIAARNLGLESYVVSGKLNGSSHTWCQIYLGEKMYIFDGYYDVFAKLPSEVSGYSGGFIANQTGFQSAGAFVITVSVKSDSGTSIRRYTWDVAKAGKTDVDFLQNSVTLSLSGKVEYIITVTSQDGSVLIYDHSGVPKKTDSMTGTLTPAPGKYTLLVEEQTSGRSFLITVDN